MQKLSMVATPIGNLEDITLRALRTFKEADIVACEDTRVTKKLLAHYDIHTPTISFHANSGIKGFEKIIGGKSPNLYITIPAKNDVLKKSFANIGTVEVDEIKNINPVDLMSFRYIIMAQPKESIAFLGGKIEKK